MAKKARGGKKARSENKVPAGGLKVGGRRNDGTQPADLRVILASRCEGGEETRSGAEGEDQRPCRVVGGGGRGSGADAPAPIDRGGREEKRERAIVVAVAGRWAFGHSTNLPRLPWRRCR
mmetsp:Transcript_6624/g.16161  ORF Transcript_6624/g.16161 Transcript_6624/m.16161 type:complete len:120 (-) Transcript_6624:127-486(-)